MEDIMTFQQGRKRFVRRKRVCEFCVEGSNFIDYKDAENLKRYVTEFGRMRPRRQTGTCAKHQRSLAVAVKRARHIALLPFAVE
ncbi:MAG: 30S ribosomal protein S18 [Chloroflexi bacterium]|nr:30S ribosomal protein S18 [Chloroflexota bacterium]MBK6709755.1 30S ribosomal protein S18 [Chloroflexota bacterium]MBK7179891.1 30S ribosomal protein S18 [Chloroflexota bacterium]MBK7918637.1 30S ribosomal protein S18 [Chloroflexota bacterium]MBK8932736.1 30S ribosomal protein S18 [Chloroflexota bacterium]